MATFTYTPSYPAIKSTTPETRKAKFGDGYQQRSGAGINNNPRVYSLTFDGDETELDPIEAFVANEGGITSFIWVAPDSVSGNWICEAWNRSKNGSGDESLTMDFIEVFGE